MRLTLLTVGRTDIPWVREGLDMYVSRIGHYVPFELREIPELKGVAALTREQIKEREGELILKQLRPADEVILLDEHGREYRSLEFADWLGRRMAGSGRDLVFVIGGAYGFSDAVYARAAGKVSLDAKRQNALLGKARAVRRELLVEGGERALCQAAVAVERARAPQRRRHGQHEAQRGA